MARLVPWWVWFTWDWWRYLLRPADNPYYTSWWWVVDWANRLTCRYRGHPEGPYFYNPGGLEPDWTCKGCGDELG